jgi:LysM repeat protein
MFRFKLHKTIEPHKLGLIIITLFLLIPFLAKASALSQLARAFFFGKEVEAETIGSSTNLQTIPLLEGSDAVSTSTLKHSRFDLVTEGGAIVAESGPLGTAADIDDEPKNDQISLYVVHKGDTLSEVAKMFDVSVNTIVWANDLDRKKALVEGQQLIILPISGVRHTVIKGDTIASIAKKYNGDADEIALYNDLDKNKSLAVGKVILIPNGEVAQPVVVKKPASGGVKGGASSSVTKGYFIRPIKGGKKTQGLHGHNGVDLASSIGAEIYASAGGVVIISKMGGWNGGYGNYVVIKHNNGTQTLYAHMLRTNVSVGQTVGQGQVIGYLGNTGNSTGPHVHFEIRGAVNPF